VGYDYYPTADMVSEYSFLPVARDAVDALLRDIIDKDCLECDQQATTNFIPFERIHFDRHGPRIEDLTTDDVEPLCKRHAFSRIEQGLRGNPKAYSDECTRVPYGGPGMYIGMSV
jgi:hypothetical protein